VGAEDGPPFFPYVEDGLAPWLVRVGSDLRFASPEPNDILVQVDSEVLSLQRWSLIGRSEELGLHELIAQFP
jgi:hypothetical protein